MSSIEISKPSVDHVGSIYKFHTTVDVLRLDQVHPVISGNKWFKLQEYLRDARQQQKKIIGTFGGAYSNHILATAAAAAANGWKSIGIIRGEAPQKLSGTLLEAQQFGMELKFVARDAYRRLFSSVHTEYPSSDIYWINEGGYGIKGVIGAQEILAQAPSVEYDYIISAVGTGTMLAGLAEASRPHQRILGVPVMKNNHALHDEINQLVSAEKQERISLVTGYDFGGYAKKTPQLISFMNDWYRNTRIPSDFVYTGKLFFAVDDLLHKKYFPQGARLLLIHSGGLQGNRSLPKGTLIF